MLVFRGLCGTMGTRPDCSCRRVVSKGIPLGFLCWRRRRASGSGSGSLSFVFYGFIAKTRRSGCHCRFTTRLWKRSDLVFLFSAGYFACSDSVIRHEKASTPAMALAVAGVERLFRRVSSFGRRSVVCPWSGFHSISACLSFVVFAERWGYRRLSSAIPGNDNNG